MSGAKTKPPRREPYRPTSSFTPSAASQAAPVESDGIDSSGSPALPPLPLDPQHRDLTGGNSLSHTTAAASHAPGSAVGRPSSELLQNSTNIVGRQSRSSSPYLGGPSQYAIPQQQAGAAAISAFATVSVPLPSSVSDGSVSDTSQTRPTPTEPESRTTTTLFPPPTILDITEKGSRSGQGPVTTATEAPTVPTVAGVESGRPYVYDLSINSTEALQAAAVLPYWTSSLHNMLASSLPTAASAAVTHVATHSNSVSTSAGSGVCEPYFASRASTTQRTIQHALVHVLQRERVRSFITRAFHRWLLHCILRLRERQYDGREAAAGMAEREVLSRTSSADQRRQEEQPTPVAATRCALYRCHHPLTADTSRLSSAQTWESPAALAGVLTATTKPTGKATAPTPLPAWIPVGGVSRAARCRVTPIDEGDVDDEDGLHNVDDDAEVPQHTELLQRQEQQHRRGHHCSGDSSSLSDAAAYVDSTYARTGRVAVQGRLLSPHPANPQHRSRVAPLIGAPSRATSIARSLSAASNTSFSQSLGREVSFTPVRQSLSWSFQALLQPQRHDELLGTSLPTTPTTVSVPEVSTLDAAGAAAGSAGVIRPTTTVAGGAAAGAAPATVRRKSVVRHLFSTMSPLNMSPYQSSLNILSSGGGSATPSFDWPHSHSPSDMETTITREGHPLRLHRARSSMGGGAGLIASDSEERSRSLPIYTLQGRQSRGSRGPSSAWGTLRDCHSTLSDSTTPMLATTLTTVPQLLASETEERLAMQAREEQRRLRLQRAMSAVTDHLMMAALNHRSSERGLHPSLRTSAAASPLPEDSDDSSGGSCARRLHHRNDDTREVNLLHTYTVKEHYGGAAWDREAVIGSSTSTRLRLDYDSDGVDTPRHLQRSGCAEEDGHLSDVTDEHVKQSLSCDDEAIDMATALSERSMQALASTSQWGAHVLGPVTIMTSAQENVDQVTNITAAPRVPSPALQRGAYHHSGGW
ncbi:hypothetical protein NXY56_000070 [Leishmania guyanensis]|uniref:Uncharacterized protein n=1 Tax=Leishmania guyanensis TaxID=5670 RepID=A0A1E1IN36_LEIGU|nr:hypothetical protein, unknown function [Leishmania guyanensis]